MITSAADLNVFCPGQKLPATNPNQGRRFFSLNIYYDNLNKKTINSFRRPGPDPTKMVRIRNISS
jgi:hypothetical protein